MPPVSAAGSGEKCGAGEGPFMQRGRRWQPRPAAGAYNRAQ
ncbi:hypothetical protein [Deinococcus wulumuqiensis]|nr:hypothetical protein [Deinococcus wulumuqiensis]